MAKQVSRQVGKTPTAPSFFRKYFYEFLIIAFTVLLYSNSLPNGYNMDDELVTINHRLTSKGMAAIPEIFSSSYYKDASGYAYDYRPFVLSTFAIEHDLFGEKPFVGHLISLLIYAMCCLLLYKVLLLLGKQISPVFALLVTLFFAAHASHTEAVCSIKNRDELLGLLLGLGAMAVGLKAMATGRQWLLVFVPVLYVCVLLNKVTFLSFAVIIPLTLLMFTGIRFLPFLLLNAGLVLPVLYLVNVSNFYLVIIIATLLFAFNLLLYVVFRFEVVKGLVAGIKMPAGDDLYSGTTGSFDYKDILGRHIIPDSSLLKPGAVLLSLVTGAVVMLGIYTNTLWLAAVAVGVLLVFAVFFKGALSWWATVVLSGCFLLPFTILPHNYLKVYTNVFVFFLSYQFFFGSSKLRLPMLLVLAFVLAYAVIVLHLFAPVILVLIVLAATHPKARFGIAGFMVALLVAHTIVSRNFTIGVTGDIVFLVLSAVVLFLQKYSLKAVYAHVVLLFVLLGWFQWHYGTKVSLTSEIQKATTNVNVYVLKDKQDRPIDFVEQPVSLKDPQPIRIGTSLRVLYHYLVKTVLPYPLAYYYGYRFIVPSGIGEPVPLLSLFLHLAIGLVAIYFMRRQPLVTYALAVYLISVATFSNYSVLIPGIVADRYLLLPSIGWSILLAFVLFAIWRVSAGTAERDFKTLPGGLKMASVAVLLLYSSITFARNFNWKDDLTLFRNDITYVKESAQANNLLGLHLMIHATQLQAGPEQKKLMQEALTHFKQTLVIAPGIFNTNFDVGRVYNLLEMPDSAVVYFDKAIAIDPSYYESHILAGQLKYRLGKPREAIPYYAYIIQNHPTEVRAYDFLSYVYFQLGEYQNSIAVNRQAVRYLPNSADPLINIGRVYESGYQNRDSAVYYYKMAYRINPLPELKKAVEMLGGKTDSK